MTIERNPVMTIEGVQLVSGGLYALYIGEHEYGGVYIPAEDREDRFLGGLAELENK